MNVKISVDPAELNALNAQQKNLCLNEMDHLSASMEATFAALVLHKPVTELINAVQI